MAIGVLTQEGLSATQEARNNRGWYLFPTKFKVSATLNPLGAVPTRDETTMNNTWFTGIVESGISINSTVLEFPCTIPIGQNSGVITNIAEVYLFAEGKSFTPVFNFVTDNSLITIPSELGTILSTGIKVTFRTDNTLPVGLVSANTYYVYKISNTQIRVCLLKTDALAGTNFVTFSSNGVGNHTIQKEFMLGLGVVNPPSTYNPMDDSISFRLQIQLASVGDPSLFQFIYSQAQEISDHNLSLTAHPAIQEALDKAGIIIQPVNFDYKGQSFDENPIFDNGVTDLKPVYLTNTGTYALAQADSTIKELNFAGFRQGNIVKSSGFVNIGTHGFALGSKVYLSPTIAGSLTTTANNTEVGIVLNSNTILLTKKYMPSIAPGASVGIQEDGVNVGTGTASTFNFIGSSVLVSETGTIANITINPDFTLAPQATELVKGSAMIATNTDTLAGLNDTKIITPLKLAQFQASLIANSDRWIKSEVPVYIDWAIGGTTITVNSTTAPSSAFYFKNDLHTGDACYLYTQFNTTLIVGYIAYMRKITLDGSTFSLHLTYTDAINGTNAQVFTTSGTNVLGLIPHNISVRYKNTQFYLNNNSTHELPLVSTLTTNKSFNFTIPGNSSAGSLVIPSIDFTNGVRFITNNSFEKQVSNQYSLYNSNIGSISKVVNAYYASDVNCWEINEI